MAKIEHIKKGFMNWYKADVAPLDIKFSLAMPVITLVMANMEKKFKPYIEAISDEHGEIDVEFLAQEYRTKALEVGGFDIMGIMKLHAADIDSLAQHIKAAEV